MTGGGGGEVISISPLSFTTTAPRPVAIASARMPSTSKRSSVFSTPALTRVMRSTGSTPMRRMARRGSSGGRAEEPPACPRLEPPGLPRGLLPRLAPPLAAGSTLGSTKPCRGLYSSCQARVCWQTMHLTSAVTSSTSRSFEPPQRRTPKRLCPPLTDRKPSSPPPPCWRELGLPQSTSASSHESASITPE